eukprot:scaffold23553_cov101-Isochrysis_galbana.AAC.1
MSSASSAPEASSIAAARGRAGVRVASDAGEWRPRRGGLPGANTRLKPMAARAASIDSAPDGRGRPLQPFRRLRGARWAGAKVPSQQGLSCALCGAAPRRAGSLIACSGAPCKGRVRFALLCSVRWCALAPTGPRA